jgi:uncharacterized phage protein gp47/JayE
MPFTSKGLRAKRFSDILPELQEELVNRLGISLDTTPDTTLGILLSIFASEVSTQESLNQAMADNFDIDKAEGVYLDSLVALSSLNRLGESFSTGSVFFKVTVDGTSIPSTTLVRDTQSNVYKVVTNSQVNSSTCTNIKFISDIFVGNATIYINSDEFTQVYTSTPTPTQVAIDLEFLINQKSSDKYTVKRVGSEVEISAVNKFNGLNVTRNENMEFTEIEGRVSVIAINTGPTNPPIDTVKTSISSNPNVISITNYDTFTVGRLRETDSELRIRHQRSPQTARSSTTSAIFSRLSNLNGVSLVRIFENTKQVTDSDGRPPHTYECIVEGGNPQVIAENIFDSRPVGVDTYGAEEYIVEDYVGNLTGVRWSRPNPQYVNVRVTYSRYNEESFPDNATQAIKDALVQYGDSLGLDVDIIPQRMYGIVYNTVSGIGSLNIEVGTSLTPTTAVPDLVQYTTNTIPVTKRDKADFNNLRIQVVQTGGG